MRSAALLLVLAAALPAWQKPAGKVKAKEAVQPPASGTARETQESDASAEEKELQAALEEAGSSPVEYARILEAHLKKYPKTEQRAEIERVLARAAVDLRDKRRLVAYGVGVIEAGSEDSQILEHTTRALLDRTDKESLERAGKYGRRLQEMVETEAGELKQGENRSAGAGKRLDDLQLLRGRALAFQARAAGGLNRPAEAADLAKAAFESYPSAEAARETARWLEVSGKVEQALPWLAQAVTILDLRVPDTLRQSDRQRLGELYRKAKGSDAGLGDLVLAAYDQNTAATAARRARLIEFDPNFSAQQVTDFTLPGLNGERLAMASLKGKVTVMDFWATWCGPCRAQYPLYEQVKARYKGRNDVVFLAINTDDDRSVVKPFLQAQNWNKNVLFDEGLSNLLKINSIPTTIVLDRDGAVVSRLNGYIADRFVEMLSNRIDGALAQGQ